MENGNLIISLDFELFWGIFDHADINNKEIYFENTLQSIPKILELFNKYKVQATWASVGFLFFDNIDELISNSVSSIPKYTNEKISAYNYIEHRYNKKFQKYHFAPDMIKLIQQTPGQEVGSHTLSHYYCLEQGQTLENFEADLKKNIDIGKKKGIRIESLVFPRNQHNLDLERTIENLGIKTIRTNPKAWFWNMNKKETFIKKVFRTADAYIPLTNTSFNLINTNKSLVNIPASRFLRPTHNNRFLNKIRLYRIKKEMSYAAKNNKNYHLWWHPHNFGSKPKQALLELTLLLKHYNKLNKIYNFKSKNMISLIKS